MFYVMSRRAPDKVEEVVYSTPDKDNASTFAESHFINTHAYQVRATTDRGRALKGEDGREYVWNKHL